MRPADVSVRTRTEAVAYAIKAALAVVDRYVRDANSPTVSEPLAHAQAQLARALRLLARDPRHKTILARVERVPSQQSLDEPHDLTRIRGIDAKAVERLNALGITRFEQIAAWEPEDVRTIGQALDLGRSFQNNGVIDQAKMLLVPPDMANFANEGGVAGWRPHAAQLTSEAILVPEPLSVEQMAAVHAVLRRGPGKAELSNFATLVPQVARAVDISIQFQDFADEAPWRPSPLLDTATPVVVDVPLAEAPLAAEGVTEPVLHVVAAPSAEVLTVAEEPLAEKPVHVVTLDRIAALDAEITAFGSRPEVGLSLADPVACDPVVDAAQDADDQPTAAADAVARGRMAPSTSMLRTPPLSISAEEADVTIRTRSSRSAPVLQPMSELPLRPKRKLTLAEPALDAPTEVSEAAVVIVKRRARERAAPDLEFYRHGENTELAS